jgi:hypothetical protein
MSYKTCNICNVTKNIDNFGYTYKTPDNLQLECIECVRNKREYLKQLCINTKQIVKSTIGDTTTKITQQSKVCSLCNFSRSESEFSKIKNGTHSRCNSCKNTIRNLRNKSTTNSQTKICSVCAITKTTDKFWKTSNSKDGYCEMCIDCKAPRKYNLAQNKLYKDECIKTSTKLCNSCKTVKSFSEFTPDKNCQFGYKSKCKPCNQIIKHAYHNNKLNTNPAYKVEVNMRSRIRHAILSTKTKRGKKCKSTIELLGCSPNELVKYLESKFKPCMSWENYGKWHVDHIKPCAAFNLEYEEHQKQCFHYTNLQPLWAEENLKKHAKYEE